MKWKALRWVVGIIAFVAAVVVLPRLLVRAYSCPNHDYPVRTVEGDSFSVVPLAGAITQIPEFHDCQRLLIQQRMKGAQAAFGPLVGVWVAEDVDERWARLSKVNGLPEPSTPGGPLARFDSVPSGGGGERGTPTLPPTALGFAQLFAWDGPYPLLGIGKHWNCLYLFPSNSSSGLAAKMVRTQDKETCKVPQVVAALTGDSVTDLMVTRTTFAGLKLEDYPPTARWDWDSKNLKQYIEVKCGAGWCDVYDTTGYAASPTYADAPATGPGNRVLGVKGWYDEQTVAVRPAAWQARFWPSLYPLIPASFTGTIVPDPGLDGKPISYFDDWVAAGMVVMSASHPKYHESHNYGPGTMTGAGPSDAAKISLCHGTNCGSPKSCKWKDNSPTDWWARIEYQGTTKYACVKRVDHSHEDRPIPGTARWYWDANDEKGWLACALGCCTVQ